MDADVLCHILSYTHTLGCKHSTTTSAGYSGQQTGTCRANNQWQLTWDEYPFHGRLLSRLPCSICDTVIPASFPAASGNVKDPHDNQRGKLGCILTCKHPIIVVRDWWRWSTSGFSSPAHPLSTSMPARSLFQGLCFLAPPFSPIISFMSILTVDRQTHGCCSVYNLASTKF